MSEPQISIDKLPILSQAGRYRGTVGYHMHSHPVCEIIYVAEGNCEINVSGQTYKLSSGDMIIVPANTEHDQKHYGMAETLFVTFSCPEYQFNQMTRVINLQGEPFIPRIFRLLSEMNEAKIYETSNGILYSLLSQIIRFERIGKKLYDLPIPLQRALEIIDNDFANADLLSKLAGRCGVSDGHLRHLFRQHLQSSPLVRLCDRRLLEARRLLHSHQYEIAEIAQRCGYPDANYFSRVFQKVTKCTPSQFREIEWNKLNAEIRK